MPDAAGHIKGISVPEVPWHEGTAYMVRKVNDALFTTGLEVRCTQHPQYKAVYKPRVECAACWHIWEARNG